MMNVQKDAVESGYWQLYRFDPRNEANPLTVDFKKLRKDVDAFTNTQNRFTKIKRENESHYNKMHNALNKDSKNLHGDMVFNSLDNEDMYDFLRKNLGESVDNAGKAMVLFGSETGNAEEQAHVLGHELKRREQKVKVSAMDDYDVSEIAEMQTVYFVVSTTGQGE